MNRQWSIRMDSTGSVVTYDVDQWFQKYPLKIDGRTVAHSVPPLAVLFGADVPLNMGGKDCRLIISLGGMDLAADGVFLRSGKPYCPLKPRPWWCWFFAAAAIAAVPFFGFRLLPVLLALIGFCNVFIATSVHTLKPLEKIFLCTFAVAVIWLFLLFAAKTYGYLPL